MPTTSQLIDQVLSLPVEERARVADSLLRSLNEPREEFDRAWVEVARRGLEELRSGKVKAVPGEEVIARINERFAK